MAHSSKRILRSYFDSDGKVTTHAASRRGRGAIYPPAKRWKITVVVSRPPRMIWFS
ncbi:MAG: hypothetical protein IPO85_14075 [Saprospiraceae bacterium]|uniref:Uncharacterized protein n=1 Tax=Candidatus Defluviibacterium haderslevense TaxID=2981993 RepID=A0A9D7SBI0_9BACT|nr:hypothetical protein [Candidatus Defluviibacterium haderslevense]